MVLWHYDGTLRSEEEDLMYIGGEKNIVFMDSDVTLDNFQSRKGRISGSRPLPMKIINFLKCGDMSICALLARAQEGLTSMLYLHDIYNVHRISIYVIESLGQTSSSLHVEDRRIPNLSEGYTHYGGMI